MSNSNLRMDTIIAMLQKGIINYEQSSLEITKSIAQLEHSAEKYLPSISHNLKASELTAHVQIQYISVANNYVKQIESHIRRLLHSITNFKSLFIEASVYSNYFGVDEDSMNTFGSELKVLLQGMHPAIDSVENNRLRVQGLLVKFMKKLDVLLSIGKCISHPIYLRISKLLEESTMMVDYMNNLCQKVQDYIEISAGKLKESCTLEHISSFSLSVSEGCLSRSETEFFGGMNEIICIVAKELETLLSNLSDDTVLQRSLSFS
jgi:hypothetical protein